MNEPLDVMIDGPVAWLTLNRPAEGNSIDVALAEALLEEVDTCSADDHVRCLVITGHGRMFCAGGDIKTFAAGGDPKAAIDAITTPLHAAVVRIMATDKPVVTLINGPAAGAGLGLAILGDLVIAAKSASFTSAYTALGVTPDGGTSWFLPRLIGLRLASNMVLTNRRVTAEEAERIGLVTRVVDDNRLRAEGAAMALELANSAIQSLARSRRLLSEGLGRTLGDQLEVEAREIASAASGLEGREGIASFIERRPARFRE
jgi:2-(1,2-epoxy-1,2-dihydrophenyl)acetyl-CoA isomerase